MIRSDLPTFLRVLGQIKLTHESQLPTWPDDSSVKYFHIICVPSCFAYFQQLLEKDGLYGIVGLHRYSWDFIALDDGILSMEMPNVGYMSALNFVCILDMFNKRQLQQILYPSSW